MEEKIMNMLEQLYIEVKATNKRLDSLGGEVKDLKAGQDNMQNDIKDLKQGQERIEGKVDSIEKHLIELDSKNAERHLEFMSEIKDMRKDLAAVEIITSKNWNEIAHLKAIK